MILVTVLSFLAFLVKACLVIFLLLLTGGIAWALNLFIVAPLFDPLKNMPGPKASALGTHYSDVTDPEKSPDTHRQWTERYGKTFRFHGFGRHDYRLMTYDFRSVSYILNSPLYQKPRQTRFLLSTLIGRGIFAVEGKDHKVLRRLVGPAFTSQATRAAIPIFFQKAEELRDRWDELLSAGTLVASSSSFSVDSLSTQDPSNAPPTQTVVDIMHWASRAMFDVIGLVGFDYHFHALQDESEEVYLAYRRLFDVIDKDPGFRGFLRIYFPSIAKFFPDQNSRTINDCQRVIRRAGSELVENRRLTILAEKANTSEIQANDILSLFIRANLSSDPSKRLSDTVLLDQLSTLLFVGHDTTAVSISWCIHLLSMHPDIQIRLREEILSLHANSSCYSDSCKPFSPTPSDSETPSCTFSSTFSYAGVDSEYAHLDAIEALPFLDGVVRETLRLRPAVHSTIRTAMKNDTIPISSSIVLRDGKEVKPSEGIPIRKGTYVHIPIEGLNMSDDIWGPDTTEFNPDRWMNLPENARAPTHPGLANTMSFSLGPHSCPAWRFAILEMKLFLSVILPHFIFIPTEDIRPYNSLLTRPYVYTQFKQGSRLPVKIQRYYAE